ncbi:hypothetical protein ECZU26_26830 [Escherichia coli]|nr:hypothetical protein ECZU26_26830 [Escherichia coli]
MCSTAKPTPPPDASGNWSVGVPAADVAALGSGAQTITASVSDRAGNSDDASRTVTVSLTAPVISINTIAGDDVINATEKDLIWRFPASAISQRARRSPSP